MHRQKGTPNIPQTIKDEIEKMKKKQVPKTLQLLRSVPESSSERNGKRSFVFAVSMVN